MNENRLAELVRHSFPRRDDRWMDVKRAIAREIAEELMKSLESLTSLDGKEFRDWKNEIMSHTESRMKWGA